MPSNSLLFSFDKTTPSLKAVKIEILRELAKLPLNKWVIVKMESEATGTYTADINDERQVKTSQSMWNGLVSDSIFLWDSMVIHSVD